MNKPRALAPPAPTIVSLREQVAPLRICRKSRAGAAPPNQPAQPRLDINQSAWLFLEGTSIFASTFTMERQFGVHSEVGKLRTVMVCRPGLAHQRLTPGNCHDLLFDDVIWVHEAQKDHYDFVLKMRERGVEVLELHDLLAETLEDPEARALDARPADHGQQRRARDGAGDAALARRDAGRHAGRAPDRRHRDAGPAQERGSALLLEVLGGTAFLMPPIPNTLFQRDPSCWIYGGVTCNPMFWPARKPETLLQRAVYKFHPELQGRRLQDLVRRLRRGLRRRHASRAATSCRSARASC